MTAPEKKDQKDEAQLERCSLCGSEISPYSPFCRNCGHPQGSPLMLWLLGAFFALLVALYLAMTLFCMCNVQRYRIYNEEPAQTEQRSGSENPDSAAPAE